MTIQNIFLLIAGVINLIMAIIVYFRGWRNKVNLYFSLLTFFNFLWALSLLSGMTLDSDFGILLGKSTYPSAIGIAISLLFFSIYFPFKIKDINKSLKYLCFFIFIFFSFLTYSNNLIIGYHRDVINNIYYLKYDNFWYILYSIFFILLIVYSVINLFYKYKSTEGLFKKQILYLLVTIILGLLFGAYFDLFLCYLGIFKYEWLGPLFTLPMNFVAFYLIFSNKDKLKDA